MNKKIKNICLGLTCLLALVFVGCVTTSEMFRGNSVSPERVVAMQSSDPKNGSIENFDIKIRYGFVRVDDVLKISGQAVLTERYEQLYIGIKHLHVYLFFLDDTSRVLETVSLATATTGDADELLEFAQSLNVPIGAVGISFGYDGEVKRGGDANSSSDLFFLLPL